MLTAKKSIWFKRVFAIYNRNLIKRRFASLNVSNPAILQKLNREFPLIIYANHSGWWDGLVAFQISHIAELDSFVMMEEKHLKRFFPFRRLGAFSIVREKPREALKSIEYSADLLKENPNRTLWIFPQGEILPNDLRPLVFYNGFSRIIAKTGKCFVLALAVRYDFTDKYKPEIFVKIGKAEFIEADENFDLKKQTTHFAEKLTANLDRLKSDILNKNFADYKNIV